MDLTTVATRIEAVAEDLTSGAAGPLPGFTARTSRGRAGYNRLIDAMNRLPRPLLALGSLAVFVVAALDPPWFECQMQALSAMPEPLWWLLGAVMAMFFGSREVHYVPQIPTPSEPASPPTVAPTVPPPTPSEAALAPEPAAPVTALPEG